MSVGEIPFNGRNLKLKDITWKLYMEILKMRKEGMEKDDDYLVNYAIEKGLLEGTDLKREELDKLKPQQVYDLVIKIREARTTPLSSGEKSPEPSSQETQV